MSMSIATTHGDGGQTGLAGGVRISKADLRVEAYGSVDELNAALGFARSICRNQEICSWTEEIQRTLFRVGGALATPPENQKNAPVISPDDVASLTTLVHPSKQSKAFSPTGRFPERTPNPPPMR